MDEWYSDWQLRRGEVYSSLADTLEQAIRSGRLPAGARLPTHRDLAKRLGVAVSTVSRAYSAATDRGLIDGAVGRGTFVLASTAAQYPSANRDGLKPLERLYLPLMQREDAIDLSLNEPLADGTEERLRTALKALTLKGDLNHLAHYQPPQGQLEYRVAGATWLRELDLDVSADDVYAVPGGQTALMTIFLGLARPGDSVLAEELTWPGALAVGRLAGIRLLPVAIDDEGMVPEAFEAACAAHRPRFVYTMPTLHNPTTATVGLGRRREIVRIARAHNVLIAEDDAYGFLVEPRPTTYCELARDITVYLTSLSKSIAPALRVGFMTVPPRLHKTLRAATRATTAMVSPVLLELAAEMIRSGAGREAMQFQAAAARRRQKLAASILGQANSAPSSMHFWLRLPSDIRNAAFVADALAQGVAVTPGDVFSVVPGHDPGGVRLCLCAETSERRVEHALMTLGQILQGDQGSARAIV
jgi:DNA-binding transcriptional MocR family regulator